MTTITALNVRLGMDVSNFSEGANLAKAETTKVASIMRQSVPPAEKYKQELDLVNKAFSDTGKKSKEYAAAVEFLAKKHQQGKYSAEEIARAQAEVAKASAAAAEATKRQKEETARLADEQKRQADRAKQLTMSVATAQEAHNRRLAEYRQLLRSGAIDQETFRRAVEQSSKTMKDAGKSTNDTTAALKKLAAGYLSFQGAKAAIKIAADMQTAAIAFEVMTGSAKAGEKTLADLRKFAASTPITLPGATNAAKTLLAFGMAAENVTPVLRMLGDVSGGDDERFRSLALAFGQMSSAGRLMGQDLLQMINAGFNPLQEISRRTGISIGDLKKRMEEGSISAKMVEDAFRSATGPTGRFFGMMDKMSTTAAGAYSQLTSAVQETIAKMLEGFLPVLASVARATEVVVRVLAFGLVPVFRLVAGIINTLIAGMNAIVAIIGDVIRLIVSIPKWIAGYGELNTEFRETNALLDQVEAKARGVAGAVGGAAAEADGLKWEFGDAAKEADKIKESFEDQVRQLQYERLEMTGNVWLARKLKLEAEGYNAEQVKALMTFRAQNEMIQKRIAAEKKAADEAIKQKERVAREMEQLNQAFLRDVEQSVVAARQFFENERQDNIQRMKDVAAGPGAGIEAGSADSARFFADQINRGIGAAAVPPIPTPGEAAIAEKADELFREQQQANKILQRQVEKTEELLAEFKQNGFRRLR
jgi:tape measure domain-containing protein